jgi:glycosyltransferase involved in cell wall biosynthesis
LESTILTEETVKSAPIGLAEEPSTGIVAFSHLRWSFVWQRPQQFLSRFAEEHPVLFIEEPIYDLGRDQEPMLELQDAQNGVVVAIPHLRDGDRWEESHDTIRELASRAIDTINLDGQFDEPILWYYSPMMVEWSLDHFPAKGVVYDCMDELSQFKFAPQGLIENERRLMDRADVVFTGGQELYEKKSRQHDNAHFFGCGVEYEHFAKAQDADGPIPNDVKNLKKPIIGWFGVIDERVDYELIRKAAELRPDYSFVLVGPVVKVDPASLPQAPNIHWLGGRDYKQLPDYCRAFDVCMMCFAINEATEFINPTKALEYLATGKPVISTPVRDVVRQYRDLVEIAASPEEFVEKLDQLVQHPDPDRIEKGIEKARESSWEGTVSQMRELILQAVGRKDQEAVSTDSAGLL